MSVKRLVLLCFLIASLSQHTLGVMAAGEPAWDYMQQGRDWDFANCNNKTSLNVQSPYELSNTEGEFDVWWGENTNVSFLTGWSNATITPENYGISNYVLRINATEGNMGVFYATEPYKNSAQIKWEVLQVRFHYPSEHRIDGQKFALEMQVTLNDTMKYCLYCDSHLGAFSLFFNLDETATVSEFWDWTDQMDKKQNLTIDLGIIFDKSQAILSQMWGYIGSDSEPNCTQNFCWYLNYPSQSINSAILKKLQDPATAWNNREKNLNGKPVYRYQANGMLYTPSTPTDEL